MADFTTDYDKIEKIWRGSKTPMTRDENISIGVVALSLMRRRDPQQIAQICDSENTRMTVGAALPTSIRLARYFKDIGLTSDDVVACVSPESTYVMPVALACLFNGTPLQAISFRLEKTAVKHLFNFTRPKVIFCDGLHYEKVTAAVDGFEPLIFTLCNHLENVAKVEDLWQPKQMDETLFEAQPLTYGSSQTIFIVASSGTSGVPKGVCLPNSMCLQKFGLSSDTSKLLSASGIDWSTGLITFLGNIFEGGTRIVTTKPFTPKYLLELIVKYKINCLTISTSLLLEASRLEEYNKETMQSIEVIVTAGAPCSEKNLNCIRSALTTGVLLYCYGLSETGGIAGRFNANKPNSVGKLFSNVQLKIVDEKSGQRLTYREIGEICVNQGYKWGGYYNNPKATAEMLDNEGFIHTGDLGYMDEDNFLFVVGRCKDIMKFKGCQCSPAAIEQIVAELPDVLDVCVFGVFDDIKNDVPAAAIVKREGSTLTAADVIKYVNNRSELPYRRIHYGVFFVKQLPRNQNGKVLRGKVKEICMEMENNNQRDYFKLI